MTVVRTFAELGQFFDFVAPEPEQHDDHVKRRDPTTYDRLYHFRKYSEQLEQEKDNAR